MSQFVNVPTMVRTWLFSSIAFSEASSKSKSSSYSTMSTSRECASSRSSSGVNFTCAGPRRPNTCTSVTGEAARSRYTLSGISVGSRSSACLDRIRATSRATFPLPITATCVASNGQCRGTSGCPSYQDAKSAPPNEPSSSTPGTSRAASRTAPVENTIAS